MQPLHRLSSLGIMIQSHHMGIHLCRHVYSVHFATACLTLVSQLKHPYRAESACYTNNGVWESGLAPAINTFDVFHTTCKGDNRPPHTLLRLGDGDGCQGGAGSVRGHLPSITPVPDMDYMVSDAHRTLYTTSLHAVTPIPFTPIPPGCLHHWPPGWVRRI